MSARVGYIYRHEDVHGVSGEGKVAEVFEASNGKVVVIWISTTPSVNTYDHIKAVQITHGHGGKTHIEWVWEAEPDKDPMDEVFARKIEEARLAEKEEEEKKAETAPEAEKTPPARNVAKKRKTKSVKKVKSES